MDLAVVVDDEGTGPPDRPVLYLAVVPHGPIKRLEGPAALIWQEALVASPEPLVERVAARAGVAPSSIADDIERFVADLVKQGLLEPQ